MDVKKICSALVMGATLLTLQGAPIQAFADAASDRKQQDIKNYQISHTPGTAQNDARLKADAQIANASRAARARQRAQQLQNAHPGAQNPATPLTPAQRNQARLDEDARIANASRIARGRERGADVANYRRSHTAGTPEYAKRVAADQENYRISHTPGTPQYTTRVNEDIKIGNASRARRAEYARTHPHKH